MMFVDINLTVYVLIHIRKGEIFNTEISTDKEKLWKRRDGIHLTYGTHHETRPTTQSWRQIGGKYYTLDDTIEIRYHTINQTGKI